MWITLGFTSFSTHCICHITMGGSMVEETIAVVMVKLFPVNHESSASMPPTYPHNACVETGDLKGILTLQH